MPHHTAARPTRIALSAYSWLIHHSAWLPNTATAMQQLLAELPLTQEHITMYGKAVAQPRLTAVAGRSMNPATRYRTANPDTPWTPAAAAVRDHVTDAVAAHTNGWQPNSLIANYFREDRTDSIAWHADDEPALGHHPTVVSVSLGATRRFRLKRPGPGPTLHTIDLADGDLLIMGGATQAEFHHAINRQTNAPHRLSLTFRNYL